MITRWLTQTATVKRLVAGLNNTEAYQTLGTVSCLIQEVNGARSTYQTMGIYRPHNMYCELGTDVKDDDHIEEGGRKFIVKGTVKREQGMTVKHLEVLLELSEG
jgi:hypothetical protein